MEPTLHNGEYLILSKLTYKLDDPERGDVIVFRYPRNPERDFIKRIVGLPGDHVEVRDGGVYVNGARLSEDYILSAPLYESTWDVGASEYFVLGDNRNNSSDSHSWGLLPAENVIGKAWITYWPPTDWGIVPHVDFAVAATP
ncbi:MAG: signal peptidase I [Chloroflexi bacterium]|nr:signal peptidase I [Chloroflexota bacterium]